MTKAVLMMAKDYRDTPLKDLIQLFTNPINRDRRFCFILGSGASREAGIKTGNQMAEVWVKEINERYTEKERTELMEELGIKSIEPNSENYFNIYDLRFNSDYDEGHAYFEEELEKGKPSLGHHALAKILAMEKHNFVITTNFDSLIEDALFIYTDKRPLVVGHESLAGFIRSASRPIIAKVHRGLYFEPFNSHKDTDNLPEQWPEPLRNAFNVYTPVVIGYAGGDRSLMEFLKDEKTKLKGLYWCYWNKEMPSKEIIDLVNSKNGRLIPIEGFDHMMFNLSRKLDIEKPEAEIRKVAEDHIKRYNDKFDEFFKETKDEETRQEIKKADDIELKKKSEEKPTAESYYEKGRIFYRKEQYAEAIVEFTNAIDLKPDYAGAYNERGNAYYYSRKYEQALADYDKALELKPDYAIAYNNRGLAYYCLQEYGKAVADYDKAIELKPDYADAYNNRGIVYRKLQKYKEAIANYDKALELEPDYAEVYYNRGLAYYYSQEYRKALADYDKALELKSDYAYAYNNRGAVYCDLKEYEKALADFIKSMELDPNNGYLYDDIGRMYYDQGKYEEALRYLSRAIELEPKLKEAYENRAKTYRALGRDEEAAADEEMAKKMF